jgi:hypothetical protein
MATKELAILIRAKDLASRTIAGVRKEVGSLGAVGSKAMHGLTTAIKTVGLAAGVGLAAAVGFGIRSLVDLARTTGQTNAVIESTGGIAGVTAKDVRKYAEDLENLTTVDDKVIQDGENMLLTFTGISKKAFPRATKAALDMAVAMAGGDVAQVDMKASAIQLGKALNDPIKGVTALSKVGVSFTKQQKDQIKALVEAGDTYGAQTIILKELELEFGKAGEAAGKGPAAVWRRLQDVGEDLSVALARGLLPVLERAGTWLTTKLADPAVVAAIDEIGQGLGRAAGQFMDFIETVDFKAIGAGLETAAGFAGGIVSAFMGMPDWVKAAVVSGWGLNKLTGGALGSIVSELGKGLIKGVLGMNAGVVNLNAGVVNGAGGAGGAGGGGGVIPTVLKVAAVAIPAALVANAVATELERQAEEGVAGVRARQAASATQNVLTVADLEKQLAATKTAIDQSQSVLLLNSPALAELKAMRASIEAQLAVAKAPKNVSGSPDERGERAEARIQSREANAAARSGERQAARSATASEYSLAQLRAGEVNEGYRSAAIIAAINHLGSVLGQPPLVTVNVTAQAVTRAQVAVRRAGNTSRLQAQ